VGDASSPIVHRWVKHCVDQGYETHLLSLHPLTAELPGAHLHLHVTDGSTPAAVGWGDYVRALGWATTVVRSVSPDLVHAHYGGGYGLLGAVAARSRFVLSLWGTDVLVEPERSKVRRLLLMAMATRARVVCVNSAHLEQAARRYTRRPVRITYFGVEPTFYRDHGGERADGDPLRLLIVKSFSRNSGLDTLLEAMQTLERSGVGVTLRAVGTAPDSWASDLVRALGLSAKVTFLGQLMPDELAEVMSASDVYVQPTAFTEGFGVAVVEAQAAGLPAIVTRIGGLAEARAPDAGVVVEPQGALALANAIREYSIDPQRLRRERSLARRHADRFRWDDVAPAMDVVYRDVLRGTDELVTP